MMWLLGPSHSVHAAVPLYPGMNWARLASRPARVVNCGCAHSGALSFPPPHPCLCLSPQPVQARGCPLRSVLAVPTPASQVQRLQSTGWTSAAAADMAAIYHAGGSSSTRQRPGNGLPGGLLQPAAAAGAGSNAGWLRPSWQAERGRIERLELLDELEEWKLLQVRLECGTVSTGWWCHSVTSSSK